MCSRNIKGLIFLRKNPRLTQFVKCSQSVFMLRKFILYAFFLMNAAFLSFLFVYCYSERIPTERAAFENANFAESVFDGNPIAFNEIQEKYLHYLRGNSLENEDLIRPDRLFVFALASKNQVVRLSYLCESLRLLKSIHAPYKRAELADRLVDIALIVGDFDAALSVMNYSRKNFEWFVVFTYAYFSSPKKLFFKYDRIIKDNIPYYKKEGRLNDESVWNMICLMLCRLEGGLAYKHEGISVLAFDDYKHFVLTGNSDFSRSMSEYRRFYKAKRTSLAGKILAGFLFLSGQKSEAFEIYNSIDNSEVKIQTAIMLINLACYKKDFESSKFYADKLSILGKMKIRLFL